MSLDKPNKEYSNSPASFGPFMPALLPDPSIRGEVFDQLLNNRGIRFIHKIAAPCPNMNSLSDNNHDPECTFCDQSQIIYIQEKEIWGVLSSNSLEKLYEIQGVWEVGTAVVTFPTQYICGEQADFNVYDQLECPDFQVRLSDLREYDGLPTTGSKYPIVRAVNIVSIVDNQKKEYVEEVDYNIVNGKIEWVSGNEPAYDEMNDIGEVLSITYVANPVYNVLQTLHELRVTQELVDGQKVAKRLPQQVLVKRDFLFKPNDGNN